MTTRAERLSPGQERAIDLLHKMQMPVGHEHRDNVSVKTLEVLEARGLVRKLGKRVMYWSLTAEGIEAYKRIDAEAAQ